MHGVRLSGPTERVGILGIGGLGHLAIQFVAKMGCEVVVFSGRPGKEAEAKVLGATEFHVTQGVDALLQERQDYRSPRQQCLIEESKIVVLWKIFDRFLG